MSTSSSSTSDPPSSSSAELLGSTDIGKLLSSEGPIVTCVLLRATPKMDAGGDQKLPAASNNTSADASSKKKTVLVDLMEEIQVDTTPKKSMVNKVLGGPFTFLGQFEDEGIMLMVRRYENDASDGQEPLPPVNPHQLQPPFDDVEVYGDILIMKVAPTDEVLDRPEDDDDDEEKQQEKKLVVPAGDDFFLDYTKEEYVAFALRTDVVAPVLPEESDCEEEEEEEVDSDAEDEDYDIEDELEEDDEEDDKEQHVAMMNLIMGQLLRRFHDENGRGPDTRELLEIRSALADKMGVEVPEIDANGADWDQPVCKKKTKVIEPETDPTSPTRPILTRKRCLSEEEAADGDDDDTNEHTKKVKFSEGPEDAETEVKVTPEGETATGGA